ncbi:protein-L-isoaspartate O-methyltransferase [Tardiphaga sp.]|uniref:protein-L-isoaspartate O-methyltransferase family protein n=1 Tax=Tardiphaga sp. TaxID=1926292 RepID=UPI002625D01A|nr:protein-L-isoaspartate O-methyltransferase [Tardiphaga sp.]MDB5617479.1 protein-L-isoaspartate O-methyltransferase [Tardiphaga sp.]
MSDFSTARQKMVDGQVRPSDVTDLRILDALLAVPREDFVPTSQRAMAYLDIDLDISAPGGAKRFLMKPVVLARMLQAAEITATDNVLVVGCATGYSAAVVAQIAGRVTATEEDPALVGNAADCLSGLGSTNVVFKAAMAVDGCAANGPYDIIVLVGATEIIPSNLYQQLAPGGRLVGVFAMTQPQRAMIVTRSGDDYGNRALFDATAPVLSGLERLPAFVF